MVVGCIWIYFFKGRLEYFFFPCSCPKMRKGLDYRVHKLAKLFIKWVVPGVTIWLYLF